MTTLQTLNSADQANFARIMTPLFEATPGLAEALWHRLPFADTAALQQAAAEIIRALPLQAKRAYAAAHPELAGAAARLGEIGAHSVGEQAGARLDRLTPEPQALFDENNRAYRARFGFPFIAAVKFHTRDSLIAAFAARLNNTADVELDTAIEEICKIVGLRIETLIR